MVSINSKDISYIKQTHTLNKILHWSVWETCSNTLPIRRHNRIASWVKIGFITLIWYWNLSFAFHPAWWHEAHQMSLITHTMAISPQEKHLKYTMTKYLAKSTIFLSEGLADSKCAHWVNAVSLECIIHWKCCSEPRRS